MIQGRRDATISLKSHRSAEVPLFLLVVPLRRSIDVISRSDTLRSVSRHDPRKTFGSSVPAANRALALNDPFPSFLPFLPFSSSPLRFCQIVAKAVRRLVVSPRVDCVGNALFPDGGRRRSLCSFDRHWKVNNCRDAIARRNDRKRATIDVGSARTCPLARKIARRRRRVN